MNPISAYSVAVGRLARERRRGDPLGLAGFGVFLIIVATVVLMYPDVFSNIVAWFRTWSAGPTMIPISLVWPLAWFLAASGVWGLIVAAIRIVGIFSPRNGVSDAFGGIFMLVVAFLLREYAMNLISVNVLWPSIVIALGGLVLLGSATSYVLHGRLH